MFFGDGCVHSRDYMNTREIEDSGKRGKQAAMESAEYKTQAEAEEMKWKEIADAAEREAVQAEQCVVRAERRIPVQRLTQLSLLTAIALGLFIVELNIPPLTSVPGVKIGLANIVTLAVFYMYGRSDALLVLLVRVFLGALASGRMSTLPYSLTGGLLCFAVCALLFPLFPLKRLWLLSMIGAVFHNVGQIAVAIIVTGTPDILWYLPVLMMAGLISGFFTGLCAQNMLLHLKKTGQLGKR